MKAHNGRFNKVIGNARHLIEVDEITSMVRHMSMSVFNGLLNVILQENIGKTHKHAKDYLIIDIEYTSQILSAVKFIPTVARRIIRGLANDIHDVNIIIIPFAWGVKDTENKTWEFHYAMVVALISIMGNCIYVNSIYMDPCSNVMRKDLIERTEELMKQLYRHGTDETKQSIVSIGTWNRHHCKFKGECQPGDCAIATIGYVEQFLRKSPRITYANWRSSVMFKKGAQFRNNAQKQVMCKRYIELIWKYIQKPTEDCKLLDACPVCGEYMEGSHPCNSCGRMSHVFCIDTTTRQREIHGGGGICIICQVMGGKWNDVDPGRKKK